MSVIIELALPADEFTLGNALDVGEDASIVLETLVPLGKRSVPFFRLQEGTRSSFKESVSEHSAVEEIRVVDVRDDETLFALDWTVQDESFFEGLRATDAQVLGATGTAQRWEFELRFPSHDTLSEFQEYCVDVAIRFEVERIYNPTESDAGPWYGLTAPQREMLVRAVEAGYYSIPREISTQDLADEFDVSDQAAIERLRRAIFTLVTNTLLASKADG